MKSNRSSKSLARAALLFNFLVSLNLLGCQDQIDKNSYKEENLPSIVKKICKEEHRIDVTVKRTASTIWIYAPIDQILDKEYGKKEDKVLDDGMMNKLRSLLTTIGRVLTNANVSPEFFALVVSDIKAGLDYTVIGNTLDLKKSYSGFIPWPEANRRYIIRFSLAPAALNDAKGEHMNIYNISMPEFLSEQIGQRIGARLQEEGRKKFFKIDKSQGYFADNKFIIEYSIKEIAKPDKEINIKEEIMDVINYCVQTYDFKDFSMVELNDLDRQDKTLISKAEIWGKKTN